MVMYLDAYVHFSQFSRFCADFRINFAQIFASVKTYVKNRGSHESSYRAANNSNFPPKFSENSAEIFRLSAELFPPNFFRRIFSAEFRET